MKAGFAKVDITPPLGAHLNGYYKIRVADHVIAPLYASAVAYTDGETTVITVSLDISEILQIDTDHIRGEVAKVTGLPVEAIFIACTHPHTAPVISEIRGFFKRDEAYYSIFVRKICDAATLAIADMKDAEAYIARGEAKDISFVRRFKMKDGTCCTNPKPEQFCNILEPIGTPDETVQLVKLKRPGAPDIAIVNFGTHPDVIGGTGICPDWPGFLRDHLERALADEADGMGVRVIFFNAAQGDVVHLKRPTDVIYTGVEHSRHMGRVLAGAVLSVYTYGEKVDCDKVFYKQKYATVELNKGTDEEVKAAHELDERYIRDDIPKGFVFNDIVRARRFIRLELKNDTDELNVVCVGFGDVAFVGLPGEPFTEIGRQIKARSPFKMTLPCCNTNGSEGYFVTDDALMVDGYESTSTLFKIGVADTMIDKSIEILDEIKAEMK